MASESGISSWDGRPGDDPYWTFLGKRGTCRICATTYKHENLSVCPNCFATYCPAYKERCDFGHVPVG